MKSNTLIKDPGKTYILSREQGQARCFVLHKNKKYPLRHVVCYSPTGFEWGYGGAGPADLALSILTDFAGRKVAESLYQQFKWDVIAKIPYQGTVIWSSDIVAWIQNQTG